ncbi:MAG TPA: acyl carrier protein [Saliniramus sp.]|nr:acyl carrier protein [Saliniramus sp.]
MNHLNDDHLRAFIVENFLFGDSGRALGPDDSLIENDIVDSTGILELVAFIEDRYGILVADAEIVPANFDTIARLRRFVSAKTARAAVA